MWQATFVWGAEKQQKKTIDKLGVRDKQTANTDTGDLSASQIIKAIKQEGRQRKM